MSTARAPDAIESIKAWRVWLASPTSAGLLTLRSYTHAGGETGWQVGEPLEARCPSGRHRAPKRDCTCGIYAHKGRVAAMRHAAGVAGAVVGEVALWGRVVEHEYGYRAQYAQPTAVWLPLILPERQAPLAAVSAALSQRAAFGHLEIPVGFYHPDTSHPVDVDELQRIIEHRPRPEPFGQQLPTICWRVLRPALLLSSMLVTCIASVAAFFLILILGVFLPLIVGQAASGAVGGGGFGLLVGIAVALAVITAYLDSARKFDIFGKVDDL